MFSLAIIDRATGDLMYVRTESPLIKHWMHYCIIIKVDCMIIQIDSV